jgi:hypothetical protein
MMELILRISSDCTEHGNTASKTILSEGEKRRATRVEDSFSPRAPVQPGHYNGGAGRGQGGGAGDLPDPLANRAT